MLALGASWQKKLLMWDPTECPSFTTADDDRNHYVLAMAGAIAHLGYNVIKLQRELLRHYPWYGWALSSIAGSQTFQHYENRCCSVACSFVRTCFCTCSCCVACSCTVSCSCTCASACLGDQQYLQQLFLHRKLLLYLPLCPLSYLPVLHLFFYLFLRQPATGACLAWQVKALGICPPSWHKLTTW